MQDGTGDFVEKAQQWLPNSKSLRQAYDQHLNMILGDVEETITSVEIDDETYEEIIKVRFRSCTDNANA